MISGREKGSGNRRSSHVDMPAAYASIGATRDPDLLRFPPDGSTPYEEVLRLGSGEERFILASSLLMTWGAQRGAGMTVEDIERGPDDEYEGVGFDANGVAQAAAPREDTFGPDGEPYLNAGTSASITMPGQSSRQVLIVYTIEEEGSVGFAWGTSDEDGPVGEQRFTVERREDDTVWAVARGFLTPSKNGLLGLKARADLRAAIDDVKKQIQALSPVIASATTVNVEASSATNSAPSALTVEDPIVEEAVTTDSVADAVVVEEAVVVEAVEEETTSDAGPTSNVHQRRPSRRPGGPGE